MIINSRQITQYLNQTLKPIYLISGDEPYLKLKIGTMIRAKAKEAGFIEHRLFIADAQFSVSELQDNLDNLSLFGEKSLIELRLQNKPTDAIKKLLHAYAENPAEDKLFFVSSTKLDASDQKTKWHKAIESIGLIVQVWPINTKELPQWIATQFTAAGLKADAAVIKLVAEKCENNLLALDQLIERLKLLDINGKISVDILLESLIDNAHYDIFQLADSVLQGDLLRVKKLFFCLKEQGVEPILILWAIARDLRILAEAAEETGKLDAILAEHRVFRNRFPLIKQSLPRHPPTFWYDCVRRAQHLDCVIKGVKEGNIWQELFALCLQICAQSSAVILNI